MFPFLVSISNWLLCKRYHKLIGVYCWCLLLVLVTVFIWPISTWNNLNVIVPISKCNVCTMNRYLSITKQLPLQNGCKWSRHEWIECLKAIHMQSIVSGLRQCYCEIIGNNSRIVIFDHVRSLCSIPFYVVHWFEYAMLLD